MPSIKLCGINICQFIYFKIDSSCKYTDFVTTQAQNPHFFAMIMQKSQILSYKILLKLLFKNHYTKKAAKACVYHFFLCKFAHSKN